jgi:hypothetical protein
VFPESSGLIGHSCELFGIGSRTQNSYDQGGSMITFAVGVLIAVIVLVGFGFLSTASAGWFFKYRKPDDTLPSTDKNN